MLEDPAIAIARVIELAVSAHRHRRDPRRHDQPSRQNHRSRASFRGAAGPGCARIDRRPAPTWRCSPRAKWISAAITLCTATALLICTVIAALFLGASLHFDTRIPVTILFVAAMASFFVGLLVFLRGIFPATVNLRIGVH